MATFTFPTTAELTRIAQEKQARLAAERLIFKIMPIRDADAPLIIWEQQDNYTGLQALRGLDGQPSPVAHVGGKRYQEEPGVYGEFKLLNETLLTLRRGWGTWNTPISLDDLIMEAQDHLLDRRLNRIEKIGWDLLTAGTFSVALPVGGTGHSGAYTFQTSTGSNWSTVTTATPLADLRAVQALGPARGANFNAGAMAIMNRVTANYLLANTNAADLGGKRTSGLANVLSMGEVNSLLTGEDLPTIVIYDEGYIADGGTFTRYLTNRKVIIVGRRPAGQTVAEYRMTRNVNNPDMGPGAYMKVVDEGEDKVPRRIQVHDGHNGGPVIYYPGSVVVLTV